MHDFNFEISISAQPLFFSRKLEQVRRSKEVRPSIVSPQFLVCLCEANYVGYTARHLHQCISELKNTVIGKSDLETHGGLFQLNKINGLFFYQRGQSTLNT